MIPSLRTLPLALPPVGNETIGSYLNRLADANHLTIRQLSHLIGPGRYHRRDENHTGYWTPQALDNLAALTGRDSRTLINAIPALGDVHRPGPHLAGGVLAQVTQDPIRPACRLCMSGRGIPGLVVCTIAHHEAVCQRHRRWLHGDDQHDLQHLPEVLQANLRHRRIVRRRNKTTYPPLVVMGFLNARNHMHQQFTTADRPGLHHRWTDRLAQLGDDPYGDPHRPTADRIHIATYPETIALLGLVDADQAADPDTFTARADRLLNRADRHRSSGQTVSRPGSSQTSE